MGKENKNTNSNIQETESVTKMTVSTLSVKSKKSSSFFQALKRVIRKKSKTSETTLKNLHLGPNLHSNSSLTINSEELSNLLGKPSVIGDIQEMTSEDTVTEVELGGQTDKASFDRKMLYCEANCPNDFYTTTCVQASSSHKSDINISSLYMEPNIIVAKKVSEDSSNSSGKNPSISIQTNISDTKLVPLSRSSRKLVLIEKKRDYNSIDIATALQIAQDLAKKLKESENNFIQLLTKYIKDQAVLQEMLDTIGLHTKLYMEADRKTSSVINLIWMQKLDGWQKQERQLKANLNILIKENRELHIKNEQLFRKSELFSKKIHQLEESRSSKKDKLDKKCSCHRQLSNILKHNEKLEEKLKIYYQQIEEFESKLSASQMQCSILENEVRTSNGDVQLLKAKLERTKTDYNLEIVSLNVKLMSNEKILRETMEVGDTILDDLGRIKVNLKKTPMVNLNWTKLKFRGNTPVDILLLCRSYIEELSKELIIIIDKARHNQATIDSLEEKNERLRMNLEELQAELTLITDKASESVQNSLDLSDCDNKIRALEEDYKILENEILKNKADYDEKVKSFNNLVASYETILKQVKEKEDVILQQNVVIEKIYNENFTLKGEVTSLQKIIKEIGSGDNSKLNAEFPRVQSEYFQLLNDKQDLLKQIDILREDNRVLLNNQQKYYEHSLKHKNEVQEITKELQIFKHKLAVEHQTLLSLQKERKKYLEEKSTLKTIFQHMKSEIDRMQKLEGTVLDISKEANRLAIIADFNKKIGEKLKEEVVQRDNTICELRDTMEKLNIIQVENTKEKLSLCHELSEVCNIKDQLSDVLSHEVQKNHRLHESNKTLETCAHTQALKFQEKELTEKEALKEIFEELKRVVVERDQLLLLQDRYIKEIKELEANFLNVQKKFDLLNTKYNKKDCKLLQLSESIKNTESSFQKTESKLYNEILEYKNKISQMEKTNQQLKDEKQEMQNTISYLKNNTQKLHTDLNESRSQEKNVKDIMNKLDVELKNAENENNQLRKAIQSLSMDKEKLVSEIDYVNNLCEKVLADFEVNIKTTSEKEESFKKDMDEARKVISKYEVEIGFLRKELELARNQCTPTIVSPDFSPKTTCAEHHKLINILEKENNSLRRDIFLMQDKVKEVTDDLKKKSTELSTQQKKSKEMSEKKEKEISQLKSQLCGVEEKHKEETIALNVEIQNLNKQIADLNETIQRERKEHVSVQLYNDLSTKFLNSNTELISKKQSLQEVLKSLHDTQAALQTLQREKEELRDQINKVLDNLHRERQKIEKLTQEKDELNRQFSEVSSKCSALETELKDASQSELDSNKMEYLRTTENRARLLKKELDDSYDMIVNLKDELSNFQQQITTLEFERCELTLRLHESQGHLETEKAISQQLRQANHQILFTVLQMRDEGKIDPVDCNDLLLKLESATIPSSGDLNSPENSDITNIIYNK